MCQLQTQALVLEFIKSTYHFCPKAHLGIEINPFSGGTDSVGCDGSPRQGHVLNLLSRQALRVNHNDTKIGADAVDRKKGNALVCKDKVLQDTIRIAFCVLTKG